MPIITAKEVGKHKTEQDCWLIIHGKVYDLTAFLPEHPGGKKIILKEAGSDATEAFNMVHPSDIMERLGIKPIGDIESSHVTSKSNANKKEQIPRPHISTCINLMNIEKVAETIMTKEAWAYYSSGSDDEITLGENTLAFRRIIFKPRVLVNVKNITTTTKFFWKRQCATLLHNSNSARKVGQS